ncbi:hypothetical protein GF359_01095 [candidate division WOR-3 bacterium]|uniref:T9SS type A sorting domain-containing protein n=1 Tax=candidate division WOR-3 bacterium TaxID=2052148 RepID=A0A9D5K8X1_UNCW3|nr:hypothetical protein [candidate division WOR-3 bacterium]MBD3363790.1 hypothetical protein [candidate division WOR-3 bacterium]
MKLKVLVTLLCVFCFTTQAGVWSEPDMIAIDGTHADFAVNNRGVCWCNPISKSLYSYHGDISGWQFETESPRPGKPYFDKGDTLWMLNSMMGMGICYTRYDGETWSGVVFVPTNSPYDIQVGIISEDTNHIWVVWNTVWLNYRKFARTQYVNGSWGEPEILSDTTEAIEHIGSSVAVDALGRVWLGWVELDFYEKPDSVIHHIKTRYWDGEDWSDEMVIATHDWLFADGPELAPDSEGGMWAMWWHEPEDAGPVFLLTRHWDGVEWSKVDTITEGGHHDLCFPEGNIAVDKEGNAWAVWRQASDLTDTNGDIYFSVNQGDGWCKPSPVCEHPAYDINPEIAVDGEGRIWCVWSSLRDSQYQVLISYATGVGVEEPVTPATPQPILTVDKGIGSSFTFRVSNLNSSASIYIYDPSGRKVNNLEVSSDVVTWDGSDIDGKSLPEGVYFVSPSFAKMPVKIILLR